MRSDTLHVEFEAQLVIRERPKFSEFLPVQRADSVALRFEFSEVFDVGGDTLDGGLQDFRVDLCEVCPGFSTRAVRRGFV